MPVILDQDSSPAARPANSCRTDFLVGTGALESGATGWSVRTFRRDARRKADAFLPLNIQRSRP